MTARVFIVLMIVAVVASIAAGILVGRFTKPGFERTMAFAIIVAAVVFPVGWWMERRGWIRGELDLRQLGARRRAAKAAAAARADKPADPKKGQQ